MIDIEAVHDKQVGILSQAEPTAVRLGRMSDLLDDVLREVEALRKPEVPDVKAWREELARIDAAWELGGVESPRRAFEAARALLDKALAAIDAGWPEPAGDVVERAAIAAWVEHIPGETVDDTLDTWINAPEHDREVVRVQARAVLRSTGRLPEPVAITDAVVEEAAIRVWCATDNDTLETWRTKASPHQRTSLLIAARAVLEYAASLGGVASAPVSTREMPCRKRGGFGHDFADCTGSRTVGASRVYRPSGSATRLPLLAACANAGLTEELTIGHLEARIRTLESERAELLLNHSPKMTIPVALPPAGKCAADRITAYRCFVVDAGPDGNPVIDNLHFASIPRAGDVVSTPEHRTYTVLRVTHYPGKRAASATFSIMLAAERTPTRG